MLVKPFGSNLRIVSHEIASADIGDEEVPRSQRLHERQVDREGGRIEVRAVADEQAERLGAVAIDDHLHLRGDLIEHLFDRDAGESPVRLALQGMEQAFGAI